MGRRTSLSASSMPPSPPAPIPPSREGRAPSTSNAGFSGTKSTWLSRQAEESERPTGKGLLALLR
jgi:hypothetical protein